MIFKATFRIIVEEKVIAPNLELANKMVNESISRIYRDQPSFKYVELGKLEQLTEKE